MPFVPDKQTKISGATPSFVPDSNQQKVGPVTSAFGGQQSAAAAKFAPVADKFKATDYFLEPAKRLVGSIVPAITGAATKVGQAYEQNKTGETPSKLLTAYKMVTGALTAPTKIAGAAIGEAGNEIARVSAATRALGSDKNPQQVLDEDKAAFHTAGKTFMESVKKQPGYHSTMDALQRMKDGWEQLKVQHPQLADGLEATGDALNFAATFAGLGAAENIGKAGLEKVGAAGEDLLAGAANKASKFGASAMETGANALEGVSQGASKIAGGVEKHGISQMTGYEPGTVENILKNPGSFTPENIAAQSRGGLGEKVKSAIDTRISDLSETGKGYEAIRKSPVTLDIPKGTISNTLSKYGITLDNTGKVIRTAETVPLSPGDIHAIEDFVSVFGKEGQTTGNAFLNARKALSNMSAFDASKTDIAAKIGRDLRSTLDDLGKEGIPGLRALDEEYAPEIKELSALKKDYIANDGSLKDGALNKIANMTGKGKDQVLGRLEGLVPGITEDINILKSVEDIQRAGLKPGTYIKGGAAGTVLGGPIGGIIGVIASSPSVAIPILRAYAGLRKLPGEAIESLITKMKAGGKLSASEKTVIKDALSDEEVVKQALPDTEIPKAIEAESSKTSSALKNPISPLTGNARKSFPNLTAEGKAKEIAGFNKMDSNFAERVKEHAALPESYGGKLINPDDMRPIVHDESKFGPYKGTEAQTVHEPSSEMANHLKDEKLKTVKPGDVVVYTSGGPGSGKGTAIDGLFPGWKDKMAFGYDSVLGNPTKAIKDINTVLSKGGKMVVKHIVRDIEDGWVKGVIKRAISKGRTVPLSVYLGGTQEANSAMKVVLKEFTGNKDVYLPIIDNRSLPAKFMSVEDFMKVDRNDLAKKWTDKLTKITQDLYDSGKEPKFTKEILNGLLGK